LYLISNVLCSGGGGDDTRFERHFGGLCIDPVTKQQVVDGLAVAPGDDAGEDVGQIGGRVDRTQLQVSTSDAIAAQLWTYVKATTHNALGRLTRNSLFTLSSGHGALGLLTVVTQVFPRLQHIRWMKIQSSA
jgi:hypothetical protein